MLKVEREGGIPAFPGAFVDWDNTARYVKRARIFRGASPERFAFWFRQLVQVTAQRPAPEQFIFLNAWNEWAEATYLEPDERHGYQYLEAVRDALCGAVNVRALPRRTGGSGSIKQRAHPGVARLRRLASADGVSEMAVLAAFLAAALLCCLASTLPWARQLSAQVLIETNGTRYSNTARPSKLLYIRQRGLRYSLVPSAGWVRGGADG
jgi:hypothetical protein